MKLTHNGKHIKTVPKKFREVKSITDYLEDEDHKRLTGRERNALENAITAQAYKEELDAFLHEIEHSQPYVLELIENSVPEHCLYVFTPRGESYHSIVFKNGEELRCPPRLYECSPKAKVISRNY